MTGAIAVVGEVVADVVADAAAAGEPVGTRRLVAHAGGGPANTAVTVARLGGAARFAGRLATGVLGTLCRERLAASGVDLSACVDASEPATVALASLDEHGAAHYEFYADGTADWNWTERELAGVLRPDPPAAIHTGSLALARQPSGMLIEGLLVAARPTSTISIDPNLRTGLVDIAVYRAAIARWAGLADLLKLSSDDLAELWPGVSLAEVAQRWHDAGVRLVVVTLGADGVVASYRSHEGGPGVTVRVEPIPVEVVDTVGAGDAYAGGLLHALNEAGALGGRLDGLSETTLHRALTVAAHVAADTCTRPSADPPWAPLAP